LVASAQHCSVAPLSGPCHPCPLTQRHPSSQLKIPRQCSSSQPDHMPSSPILSFLGVNRAAEAWLPMDRGSQRSCLPESMAGGFQAVDPGGAWYGGCQAPTSKPCTRGLHLAGDARGPRTACCSARARAAPAPSHHTTNAPPTTRRWGRARALAAHSNLPRARPSQRPARSRLTLVVKKVASQKGKKVD
jgi:hypothetical protein